MSSWFERSHTASLLKGAGGLLRSVDGVLDGIPDQFDLRQHGFALPSTDQGRTDRCSAYAVAGAAACWAAVHEQAASAFQEEDLFLRGDRQPDLERMLVAARGLGLVDTSANGCNGDGCSRRARCGTHDQIARRIDYRILAPLTSVALYDENDALAVEDGSTDRFMSRRASVSAYLLFDREVRMVGSHLFVDGDGLSNVELENQVTERAWGFGLGTCGFSLIWQRVTRSGEFVGSPRHRFGAVTLSFTGEL